MIEYFFVSVTVGMCLLMLMCLYRAVFGPTVFDRIIGSGFIGTKAAVLIILIGYIYGRPDMFIDLAIGYSILNFMGTIVISKYFIKKGHRE
ncbi:MAG: monovalent cation/H+ antiporter complex subunit F [Syntrophales bacterium]|nr:monovalent cation/H+ antiporter complex subunit F [Syntrophales bacterium]